MIVLVGRPIWRVGRRNAAYRGPHRDDAEDRSDPPALSQPLGGVPDGASLWCLDVDAPSSAAPLMAVEVFSIIVTMVRRELRPYPNGSPKI